jgi:hypothetical protein
MSNQEWQGITTLRSHSFHRSAHLGENPYKLLRPLINDALKLSTIGQINTSKHPQISDVINTSEVSN